VCVSCSWPLRGEVSKLPPRLVHRCLSGDQQIPFLSLSLRRLMCRESCVFGSSMDSLSESQQNDSPYRNGKREGYGDGGEEGFGTSSLSGLVQEQ